MVYSIGSIEQGDTDRTITTSTANGQTQLWNIGNNQFVDAATSTIPGAATVSPTYTASSSRVWTLGAVSIKPAAGSWGRFTSTFTQTPGFCSAFDMPAGGALSVRNYVSVPSGSLPANPAITATLQHGVTGFATLSSPTATLISGGADTVTHEATTSRQQCQYHQPDLFPYPGDRQQPAPAGGRRGRRNDQRTAILPSPFRP